MLSQSVSKAATKGAALLSFLVIGPHGVILPLIHHVSAVPLAEAATTAHTSTAFPIPGSVALHVGETAVDTTGHYQLLLDAVEGNGVHVMLEYRNCMPTHCLPTTHPTLRTVLSLHQSVRYSGRTVTLASLSGDAASFSVRE